MAPFATSEVQQLCQMDPELVQVIQAMTPYPEPDYANPSTAIAQMRAMIQRFNDLIPIEGVSEETLTFPTRDGFALRLLVFWPTHPTIPPSRHR